MSRSITRRVPGGARLGGDDVVTGGRPRAWPKTRQQGPLLAGTRRPTRAGTSVTTGRRVTRSVVRWGRAVWPPGPVRGTPRVAGGGDGTGLAGRPARRQPGVAVQREDRADAVQPPLDDVGGAAGQHSSAGWKISRTRPGSAPRCSSASSQAGAEDDRGVHVVAAGVARGPRWSGTARPWCPARQAVDVGPQGDDRAVGRCRCRRSGRSPRAGA